MLGSDERGPLSEASVSGIAVRTGHIELIAGDGVPPCATRGDVTLPVANLNVIDPAASTDRVSARATDEDVVAPEAKQTVVAPAPCDAVGLRRATKRVRATGPIDREGIRRRSRY